MFAESKLKLAMPDESLLPTSKCESAVNKGQHDTDQKCLEEVIVCQNGAEVRLEFKMTFLFSVHPIADIRH